MSDTTASDRVAADVLGVVIAGGRSVRFGGEKAAAILAGKPLLMWAVGRLQRCCREVAVNARPDTEAEAIAREAGLTVLHDEAGDAAGPLAGVKVGLIWAQEQGARSIAVSPCDVPMLPPDLYPKLIGAAGDGAALAESDEGHQPQCAVWPVSALPELRAALSGGQHPATWMMLQKIGAQRVRFPNRDDFANINTRIDLTDLSNRLQAQAALPSQSDDGRPHYQR